MQPLERRAVLKVALGVVLGLDLAPIAAAEDVRRLPEVLDRKPATGWCLPKGASREIISIADLQPDGRRVNAFPVDPRSSLIRDGSRLNKILLVRCDPERLSEETRHRAVEGVAAYSAICTHQGCEVGSWDDQTKTLWCPCHDSKYDPRRKRSSRGGTRP
jgi:nitrite reductase/ring-hydroxylating ferredoxin subunit